MPKAHHQQNELIRKGRRGDCLCGVLAFRSSKNGCHAHFPPSWFWSRAPGWPERGNERQAREHGGHVAPVERSFHERTRLTRHLGWQSPVLRPAKIFASVAGSVAKRARLAHHLVAGPRPRLQPDATARFPETRRMAMRERRLPRRQHTGPQRVKKGRDPLGEVLARDSCASSGAGTPSRPQDVAVRIAVQYDVPRVLSGYPQRPRTETHVAACCVRLHLYHLRGCGGACSRSAADTNSDGRWRLEGIPTRHRPASRHWDMQPRPRPEVAPPFGFFLRYVLSSERLSQPPSRGTAHVESRDSMHAAVPRPAEPCA